MSLQFRQLVLLLACTASLCSVSHGQDLGSITARLVDPNGAVITNLQAVSVSMRNKTGEVTSIPLPATGIFTIAGLAPGDYDLVVPIGCCMYTPYERQGVSIAAGKELKIDLPIGWGMNLGTIGDDPVQLANDMRAGAGDVSGPAPRTSDGKVDFGGFWSNLPVPPGGAPRLPPMQPWAAEMQQQLQKVNTQNAGAYCLPQFAIPVAGGFPYKIIQSKDALVSLTEFMTPGWRQVFLDGRPHPPMDEWNPAWHGHSVGHWEGDTLVIDTVGYNEVTPGFAVHSEKLHVIERWTRPDRGRLQVDVTATDPEAWTGEFKFSFTAGLVPNQEVLEFICAENNQDILHFGADRAWRGRP